MLSIKVPKNYCSKCDGFHCSTGVVCMHFGMTNDIIACLLFLYCVTSDSALGWFPDSGILSAILGCIVMRSCLGPRDSVLFIEVSVSQAF